MPERKRKYYMIPVGTFIMSFIMMVLAAALLLMSVLVVAYHIPEIQEDSEQSAAQEEMPPTGEVPVESLYTDEDVDLLARLIYAEAGCNWMPDDVQLYVGSVVLNRIASDSFPNTLYDVVYQPGQYGPAITGAINNTPDERTIANAEKLLRDGSVLPEDVVFQAGFLQGSGVHTSYYDSVLRTTIYFCYM